MITINATVRDVKDQGKGASRRLRAKNKFPAVVYGGTEQAISIVLEQDVITNLESKPGFYGEPLTLMIDDKANNVKVQAVQRHPFKPKFTHIDFMRVYTQ